MADSGRFCKSGNRCQARPSLAGWRLTTTSGGMANRTMRLRIAANRFRVTDPWAICKRRGIDEFRYLADVLRRLPTTPFDRRTELLADVWLRAHRRRPENGLRCSTRRFGAAIIGPFGRKVR